VTNDRGDYERIAGELAADLSASLRGAAVSVEHREELPASVMGKFRPIVGV